MKQRKRWLYLVLTLVLCTPLILPAYAADPLADSFAAFLIDAAETNAPAQDLQVELYRRNEDGVFQASSSVRYSCSVNQTAGQAAFYIQPQADGVWMEVNYLTDLNCDGVYEFLDGQSQPVSDSLNENGQLVPWSGSAYSLTRGQTYILSSDALIARANAALQARNISGSGQSLPWAGGLLPKADTVLYLVTLHYPSTADQTEYTLCYYLRLFDSVIIPSDVPYGSWYYDAVEYAMAQGILSVTGPDTFSPNEPVTRAQLAQILWCMGGALPAKGSNFSDVSSSDWYYTAVSWCSQTRLMVGSGSSFLPNAPLTRQELAAILQQYAQYNGLDVTASQSLIKFTDGSSISIRTRKAVGWAVANGLLSGYDDGSLRPVNGISRAELAVVLRAFYQNILEA